MLHVQQNKKAMDTLLTNAHSKTCSLDQLQGKGQKRGGAKLLWSYGQSLLHNVFQS